MKPSMHTASPGESGRANGTDGRIPGRTRPCAYSLYSQRGIEPERGISEPHTSPTSAVEPSPTWTIATDLWEPTICINRSTMFTHPACVVPDRIPECRLRSGKRVAEHRSYRKLVREPAPARAVSQRQL